MKKKIESPFDLYEFLEHKENEFCLTKCPDRNIQFAPCMRTENGCKIDDLQKVTWIFDLLLKEVEEVQEILTIK